MSAILDAAALVTVQTAWVAWLLAVWPGFDLHDWLCVVVLAIAEAGGLASYAITAVLCRNDTTFR